MLLTFAIWASLQGSKSSSSNSTTSLANILCSEPLSGFFGLLLVTLALLLLYQRRSRVTFEQHGLKQVQE